MTQIHDWRQLVHERLTMMIRMLIAHITVSERGDMQIRCHFFYLYASVNSARWAIDDFVVRGAEGSVLSFGFGGKQSSKTGKGSSLIRGVSPSRGDDTGGRRCGWGDDPDMSSAPDTTHFMDEALPALKMVLPSASSDIDSPHPSQNRH
jgi:hypothetical protein